MCCGVHGSCHSANRQPRRDPRKCPPGGNPTLSEGPVPVFGFLGPCFTPPITTSCSWEDPTALVLSRRHLRQINTSACEHMACLWKGTQDSTLGGVETQSCTDIVIVIYLPYSWHHLSKQDERYFKKKKVIADINDVTCALRWVGCCYLGRMAFFF